MFVWVKKTINYFLHFRAFGLLKIINQRKIIYDQRIYTYFKLGKEFPNLKRGKHFPEKWFAGNISFIVKIFPK